MSCGIHHGPCGWTRAKGCPIVAGILAELDREELTRSVHAKFFDAHSHGGGRGSLSITKHADPVAHREATRRWREKKRRQRSEGRAA